MNKQVLISLIMILVVIPVFSKADEEKILQKRYSYSTWTGFGYDCYITTNGNVYFRETQPEEKAPVKLSDLPKEVQEKLFGLLSAEKDGELVTRKFAGAREFTLYEGYLQTVSGKENILLGKADSSVTINIAPEAGELIDILESACAR